MKLQEWFIEKDYGIGLALLGEYCKNRVLLQNLGRKHNPEKLEYELRKEAEKQGIVIGTVEETEVEVPEVPLPPAEETAGAEQTSESHSDQVIDQMNADKTLELKEGANQMVKEKLED